MKLSNLSLNRTLPAALATAALSIGLGSAAGAQTIAIVAQPLQGTVVSYDGKFDARVQTPDGQIHDVLLHRGTDIEPTGITIRPGMIVTAFGNANADALQADKIVTNYHRATDGAATSTSQTGWAGLAFPTNTLPGATYVKNGG